MSSSILLEQLRSKRTDYRYQKLATERSSVMDGADKPKEAAALLRESGKDGSYGRQYDEINPLTLTWDKVNVFATPRDASCTSCRDPEAYTADEKQILFNVSGIVRPGELLAIMGASGAGKTTLMNYLTYRSDKGLRRQGQVKVNGQALGKDIKFVSAYVQQDDLFISSLTVKETLWFQAQLRIDEEVPDTVRSQRVDEVIHELGMDAVANDRIGRPGQSKALSSGERKRLSFASEVITNPALMFCDEPTSGLDSYMAQAVVETLRRMASRGRTIVCTIHQPSSEVYRLLDRICFMSEGRMAYIGPKDDLLKFFHGAGYPCPADHNPADFFIHTLAIVPGMEEECRRRVHAICDAYDVSNFKKETEQAIVEATESGESGSFQKSSELLASDESSGAADMSLRYKSSWWKQFRLLLWRVWSHNSRNPAINKGRVIQILIQTIVGGLVFFQQDLDQKGVQNINGVLFLLQMQLTGGTLFAAFNIIPSEFPLFMREHQNGMYKVSCYYLAHILCEIPFFIIIPSVIVTLIAYAMIGLYMSVNTILVFLLTLVLLNCAVLSFGHAISTGTVNVSAAVALANLLMNPLIMFGGTFINLSTIKWYFKPLSLISWFSYANEILVVNQWKDVDYIACEYSRPIYGYVNGSLAYVAEDTSMCYNEGSAVIASYSFSTDNVAQDLLSLAGLALFFEALAYLSLAIRARQK